MEEIESEEEGKEYLDKSYMKKNKFLCNYCSYRAAVPSKNNQYCSEMCRLMHLCISKQIPLEDIAKLIKVSKIDLIDIILTLKCQKIQPADLHKICNKPYEYKQAGLKITHNHNNDKLTFD